MLHWLCEGLHLAVDPQVRRIRRKRALADDLLSVQVETEGGTQTMLALTLRALPGWLYTIDDARVAEHAREDVVLFQRECVDVLAAHFAAKHHPALPAPQTLVPSEHMTEPAAPTPDATRAERRAYYQTMLAWLDWLDWQDDMDKWRGEASVQLQEHERQIGELYSRVESTEELTRMYVEVIERLGPQTLSPEHQRTVQAGVNRLHDLTGRPYAAIYNDLREAFHIGTYKDIPESRWAEVVTWLRARLAGSGGQAPEQESLF